MSDTSQGEGWWIASDGKWYPPEQQPHVGPYGTPNPGSGPNQSRPPQQPTNLWGRFRGLPRGIQIASWIVAGVILLAAIGALTGGNSTKTTSSTNSTVATTTSTLKTHPTTTTTTEQPTTTLPPSTTAPPTTAPPTTAPPTTAPPTTAPPQITTVPPVTPTPTAPLIVHPGSFCSPPGTGVTSAGTPMVCGIASDGRYRWIHA